MRIARRFAPAVLAMLASFVLTAIAAAQRPEGRLGQDMPRNADEQMKELEGYRLNLDDFRKWVQVRKNMARVARESPALAPYTSIGMQDLDSLAARIDSEPILLKAVRDAGFTTYQYATLGMILTLTAMASINTDTADALKMMKEVHLNPANLEFLKQHEKELEALDEESTPAPALQLQAERPRRPPPTAVPQQALPEISPEAAAALDGLSQRYAAEASLMQGWFRDRTVLYYDFGAVPTGVAPARVLWPIHGFDTRGNPVAIRGQRPIFTSLPGLGDYSGLWRITYVVTADKVQPNAIRDTAGVSAAVRARRAYVRESDVIVNLPLVARGTTLARDTTTGMLGWFEGRDVQFFDFGQASATPVSMWRFARGRDASGAPNLLSDQNSIVDSIPVSPGYPDVWAISIVDVDSTYVANSLKSASAVQTANLRIANAETQRNLPIVSVDGAAIVRVPSPIRMFSDLRSPFPPRPTPPQ